MIFTPLIEALISAKRLHTTQLFVEASHVLDLSTPILDESFESHFAGSQTWLEASARAAPSRG
jgi:hypothetical protein